MWEIEHGNNPLISYYEVTEYADWLFGSCGLNMKKGPTLHRLKGDKAPAKRLGNQACAEVLVLVAAKSSLSAISCSQAVPS